MGSSSERRVQLSDRPLIRREVTKAVEKVQARGRKAWVKYIDVQRGISWIMGHPNAWIVGDAYLVVYDFATPEFVREDIQFLQERLVLALVPGGNFPDVTSFLRRKAREAGCPLAQVGTALSVSDKVLASLYQSQGFSPEGSSLVTEIQ